jgi:hypothetical protein
MPIRLRKERKMKEKWSYKEFQIIEGLKPGSKHFQYFFSVAESGEKKCNYCVWIEDDALSQFDKSGQFQTIISSQRDNWNKWVMEKIDQGDFRNRVLKFAKEGQTEIDLSELKDKMSMD